MVAHHALIGYRPPMNITPAQCRAARALVEMTQNELAQASGVSLRSINNFERGERMLMRANMSSIVATLATAGVVFIDENSDGPGVRLAKKETERAKDG